MTATKEESLKAIKEQIAGHYHAFLEKKEFVPGTTLVPVSGKVYDAEELQLAVEAALDCWWTEGHFTKEVSDRLATYLGVRYVSLCNSGSSANLLAITSLMSPLLGERRPRPGDEVIGVAAGFPTSVAPIIQNGMIPVLLDIEIGTYNVDVTLLEAALSPRTKAIMIAHTLGNPWDIDAVMKFARVHNLWIIEDACDALGATYRGQFVGTFGDIATLSFYPAHHITAGEGGAVLTNNSLIKRAVESYRDWGRDCWCPPGKDNTCKKRFLQQFGKMPMGYDHKYIYSHVGYNLKMTDFQGALLLAQLKKLPGFVEARRKNFETLAQGLARYERWLILPRATAHSDPSWFGFLITVRDDAGFSRVDLVAHLEKNRVATRMLFAGNITKQPMFEGVHHRVIGELKNTDIAMNSTFWIGVWPGITHEMYAHVLKVFEEFFKERT